MIKLIKDLLQPSATAEPHSDQCIRQVSAALMIEVARADDSIEQDELKAIANLVREHQDLDTDSIDQLVNDAMAKSDASTSLYEFTQAVNSQLNDQEKVSLILNMWRIAWVDGTIDPNEDNIIRRVSELIYVPHTQFIWAKNTARDERTN